MTTCTVRLKARPAVTSPGGSTHLRPLAVPALTPKDAEVVSCNALPLPSLPDAVSV
ncbi:MAG: hypothetical protein U0802_10610 [Candidatus Binatia bacterium]